MKTRFYLFLLLISTVSFSQSKLLFEYDTAGNQIKCELCVSNCATLRKIANPDVAQLKQEDYIKSFPEDVISYYPNPVKEELYLKWELKDNNKVTTIQLYSLSGQLIKSISKLDNQTTQTVAFQQYPQGTYVLLLLYSDGDQKSIQIVKQ
jgi:hypothetical protein